MSIKQRFSVVMMTLIAAVMVALLVRMIACGDGRLWAAELALLCAFAVALRSYALEWRKLRDQKEHEQNRMRGQK
ncbi:MAG: hypothetical protein RRZ83_04885 [Alistipes sp.]